MKKIASYKNGNYNVLLLEDGTKIRYNNEDELIPEFYENIDLCISKKCTLGSNCKNFCHEGASPCGEIAKYENIKKIINSLHPHQELAIGGGALTDCTELINFIKPIAYLNQIIINITLNSKELKRTEQIESILSKGYTVFVNNIHGIGVSYNREDRNDILNFRKFVEVPENIVIHTIAGITEPEDYIWLIENDFKFLILGFKEFRNGVKYSKQFASKIKENQEWLKTNLQYLRDNGKMVSLDCLAIEQLNIKEFLSEKEWKNLYMGDDGKFTCYIDAVNMTISKSSTSPLEERKKLVFNKENKKINFKKYLEEN